MTLPARIDVRHLEAVRGADGVLLVLRDAVSGVRVELVFEPDGDGRARYAAVLEAAQRLRFAAGKLGDVIPRLDANGD